MDQDIGSKQRQKSKFFESVTRKSRNTRRTADYDELPVAGPSRLSSENKENVCIVIDDSDEINLEEDIESNASIVAQGEVDPETEMVLDDPSWHDIVEQEDGYISPTPSCSGDVQDFSSPLVPRYTPVRKHEVDLRDSVDRYFGTEAVSSPPSEVKLKRRRLSDSISRQPYRTRSLDLPRIHGHAAQRPNAQGITCVPSASFPEVDLRGSFGDDRTSDIDSSDNETKNASGSNSPPTPTPSPLTPVTQEEIPALAVTDDDVLTDTEDSEAQANEFRKQAVITGWRQQWALNKAPGIPRHATPKLKRRETNVTPAGRHTLNNACTRPRPYPLIAPNTAPPKANKPRRVQSRKSLPFLEPGKHGCAGVINLEIDLDGEHDSETVLHRARLETFR